MALWGVQGQACPLPQPKLSCANCQHRCLLHLLSASHWDTSLELKSLWWISALEWRLVMWGWVNTCQLSSSLSVAAVSEQRISKSVMMNIPERAGFKYFIASDTENSHLESFSYVLWDHSGPGEEQRLCGSPENSAAVGHGVAKAKSPALGVSWTTTSVPANAKTSRNWRKKANLFFFFFFFSSSSLLPLCCWAGSGLQAASIGQTPLIVCWISLCEQHYGKLQPWLRFSKHACSQSCGSPVPGDGLGDCLYGFCSTRCSFENHRIIEYPKWKEPIRIIESNSCPQHFRYSSFSSLTHWKEVLWTWWLEWWWDAHWSVKISLEIRPTNVFE